MDSMITFGVTILVLTGTLPADSEGPCDDLQYLDLGESGVIQCNFGIDFYGVFWYNTTEHRTEYPFFYYVKPAKSGRGHTSGEFDIFENGSLVINNVSLQHEHFFRVVMFLEEKADPKGPYDILVKVIVRSSLDYPLIDRCEQEGRICLVLSSHADLSCFVTNSRPAAKLTWWIKTRGRISNISASSLIVEGAHWLTSYANITFPLPRNSPFMLFVCKVARIPSLLPLSESMVLVDHVSFSPFSNVSDHILAAQETMVFINCSDTQPIYVIWKYQVHDNEYRKLGYFTSEGGLSSKTYSEKVQITGNNGALIIYNVLASDEGVYVCSYDTDSERGIKVYNLTVYALPQPRNLLVEGCISNEDCTITINHTGTLTCSVKRIRPEVSLKWNTVLDERSVIRFTKDEIDKKLIDGLYDVTLTSRFQIINDYVRKLSVECVASNPDVPQLNYRRRLELHLDKIHTTEVSSSGTTSSTTDTGRNWIWGIIAVSFLCLVGVIAIYLLKVKTRRGETLQSENRVEEQQMENLLETKDDVDGSPSHALQQVDEMENLLESSPSNALQQVDESKVELENNSTEETERGETASNAHQDPDKESGDNDGDASHNEKAEDEIDKRGLPHKEWRDFPFMKKSVKEYKRRKDQFIQDLAATYRTRYEDVRAVQLEPNEHYTVNRLFVEGNIQSLRITKLKRKPVWEDAASYHAVLSSENMKGSVVIIEGEVGLGKSMLAVKFLADWCEKKTESPLSNVEIVICLSASQLVQHSGIHQAIEEELLPVGSRVSGHVYNILHNSHSILLLLEDVEEMHCKHDTVLNILRRRQLPRWKVVITTRSFHFVKNIVISYKRFRLIYFNKTVRENYIRKAETEKQKPLSEKWTEILKVNVLIDELCKVPLLFVAYVHMAFDDESEEENLERNILEYLWRCFIDHHRNKCRYDDTDTSFDENMREAELGKFVHRYSKGQYERYTESEEEKKVFEDCKKLGLLREEQLTVTILGEWCIAKYITSLSKDYIGNELSGMNADTLFFSVVFICYMKSEHQETVISFLKAKCEDIPPEWFKYKMTKTKESSSVKPLLRDYCKTVVNVRGDSPLVVKRSQIELLKVAVSKQIPIECLQFTDCLECTTEEKIVLMSKMEIPVLGTVKKIAVAGKQEKVTIQQVQNMLRYCLSCSQLETLEFLWLMMPWSLNEVRKLKFTPDRKIEVLWKFSEEGSFTLDWSTGLWKNLHHQRLLKKKKYTSMISGNKLSKEATASLQDERDEPVNQDEEIINDT